MASNTIETWAPSATDPSAMQESARKPPLPVIQDYPTYVAICLYNVTLEQHTSIMLGVKIVPQPARTVKGAATV